MVNELRLVDPIMLWRQILLVFLYRKYISLLEKTNDVLSTFTQIIGLG